MPPGIKLITAPSVSGDHLLEQLWIVGYGDQIDVQGFPRGELHNVVARGEFESLETNQRHLAVVGGHRPAPRGRGPQLRPVERSVIDPEVQGIMIAGWLI